MTLEERMDEVIRLLKDVSARLEALEAKHRQEQARINDFEGLAERIGKMTAGATEHRLHNGYWFA